MSHSVPRVSHHAMLRSCADYDQYYASLAASEAPSTLPTPGLGEFGEEEDVKPNLEYLDSLNEYRKRSRSREDVGTGGSTPKLPRTDSFTEVHDVSEAAAVSMNGFGGEEAYAGGAAADDPIVYGAPSFCPYALVPRLTSHHQ